MIASLPPQDNSYSRKLVKPHSVLTFQLLFVTSKVDICSNEIQYQSHQGQLGSIYPNETVVLFNFPLAKGVKNEWGLGLLLPKF